MKQQQQQHGSALIISLLILLVMTIIGISAMSSSTMEEKMAANDLNQKAIFQNAESVLVEANTTVFNTSYETLRTNLEVNATPGVRKQDDAFNPLDPNTWKPGVNCTAVPNNSNRNGNSCFVVKAVQQTGESRETRDYDNPTTTQTDMLNVKVTVHSTDGNDVSTVTLQNVVQKPVN